MSRNLVYYDIKKLESLPTRTKLYDCINCSLKYKREITGWSNSKSNCKYWRQAKKIIEGSVGMHVDVIFPRVKAILTKYGDDTIEQFNYLLDREVLVDGESKMIGYRGSPSEIYGHYINLDGIISFKGYERYRRRPLPEEIRNYREIRKKNKIDSELIGKVLLLMINQPELMKFYTTLLSKRKGLLDKIYKTSSPLPEKVSKHYDYRLRKHVVEINKRYNQDMRWWKYMEEERKEEAEKAKNEIRSIQEQINNLEAGNFNVFFESNVYLYNLQKDCHHFEKP